VRTRRWRFSLIPSLAALVVISVTVSLGNWQMRRASEKEAAQITLAAADRLEPIQLPGGEPTLAALADRRVQVRGSWMPEFTVFIDNRTHRGVSGFHVVTPFKIEGVSTSILVLRGWVAGDPARRNIPPVIVNAQGTVQLSGRVMPDLPQTLELKTSPEPAAEDRVWQNASLERVRRWTGLSLADFVIRQTESDQGASGPFDDRLIREWREPGTGVDKHRGYAAQWYGLAALALVLWIWNLIFVSRRP
jgi:surfeit locus 1 family protein